MPRPEKPNKSISTKEGNTHMSVARVDSWIDIPTAAAAHGDTMRHWAFATENPILFADMIDRKCAME
jgi:hypothetical protein